MNKTKRNRFILIILKSSLSFLICSVFTFAAITFFIKQTTIKEKRFSKYLSESKINTFISNLNSVQYAAAALEGIISHKNELPDNIEEFVELQLSNHTFINSIFLAPDGEVKFAFPYTKRENLFFNLLKEETTKLAFEKIEKQKYPLLIGQVPLRTGYDGFIYVQPVYNNHDTFWGFIIYALETHDLMYAADFQSIISQNYRIELTYKGIDSLSQGQRIFSSVPDRLKYPVNYYFTAADNHWCLSVEPINGWCNKNIVIIIIGIAIILSIFVMALVILLYYFQDRERALEILSSRDPLTNLYNTRAFTSTLNTLRQKGRPFGLVNIDVNDFKLINDTYGHATGDEILNIAAKKILNCIRKEDSAFRTGGDEFAIIVNDIIDRSFYDTLKSRLKTSMNHNIIIKELNISIKLSMSIGFSIFPNDSSVFDEIIRLADREMYKDKRLYKVLR